MTTKLYTTVENSLCRYVYTWRKNSIKCMLWNHLEKDRKYVIRSIWEIIRLFKGLFTIHLIILRQKKIILEVNQLVTLS